MQWKYLVWSLAILGSAEGLAQAQDATLKVSMRAAGGGYFFNNNGGLTQVSVQANSTVAAMYNGPTNIVAPDTRTAVGGTFQVEVPRLYSGSRVAGNKYTVELSWPDTTRQTLRFGPIGPLAPGVNLFGAGGLGSTTPIDVTNQAPPASSNFNCYPDPPDTATTLYTSWSFSATRPVDFKEFQLHRSTTAGFTPSMATLVTTLPYGTSFRRLAGLAPGTTYYFCVRTVDSYDHVGDHCSPKMCTTTAATSMDLAAPQDLASPADLAAPRDLASAADLSDPAGRGDDGTVAADLGTMGTGQDSGAVLSNGANEDAGVGDPNGDRRPGLSGGGLGCQVTRAVTGAAHAPLLATLLLLGLRRRRRGRS